MIVTPIYREVYHRSRTRFKAFNLSANSLASALCEFVDWGLAHRLLESLGGRKLVCVVRASCASDFQLGVTRDVWSFCVALAGDFKSFRRLVGF